MFDVPRRQLMFALRHGQWQPPLALCFVPRQGQGREGRGGLLLHATDRQHVVAVDTEEPRWGAGVGAGRCSENVEPAQVTTTKPQRNRNRGGEQGGEGVLAEGLRATLLGLALFSLQP